VFSVYKQLGYIVSVLQRKGPPPTRALGWSVVVQGPNHTPEYFESRIEAWIESFRTELASMSSVSNYC
jgi:secreted Zn-dependent insulinase-like peptidase